MKKLKKMAAMLLALTMILMMSVPVSAAGEYSISITNSSTGHTYEAYQIFSGTLSNGVLSNISWGSGVDGSELLNALKTADDKKYGSCTDAADVAKALAGEEGNATAADAQAFAEIASQHLTTPSGTANTPSEGKYTISGLNAGYYLVKDKDNTLEGTDDSYTAYIVKVLGNVEMAPKSDTATSEKKVKDINDSTDTSYGDWADTADHDIGDSIPFRLKGTLPDNYSDYDSYALTFHDTESSGLTFQQSSVKVYIDGKLTSNGYTVVTEGLSDGYTFEVRFDNLKNVSADDTTKAGNNSVITVEYESVLNENAVIGSTGNPNRMLMTFSNNPNGTGTGKTPVDTVIVFTYKVLVGKVDQNQAPLQGAEFTLEKKMKGDPNDTWTQIDVLGTAGTLTSFEFKGLDDGDYRLTETKTPAGYNTIDPITFTVTAVHEDATLSLTSLNGNVTSGAVQLTFTPNTTEGSLSTTVINNQGLTLPETGGIGTTIFYVLGVLLVLGAGIPLAAKLRMKGGRK